MITMNVTEGKVKEIKIKNSITNSEIYGKIWKSKYNIVIAKSKRCVAKKIIDYVKNMN
jgi:hypothetical protein